MSVEAEGGLILLLGQCCPSFNVRLHCWDNITQKDWKDLYCFQCLVLPLGFGVLLRNAWIQ